MVVRVDGREIPMSINGDATSNNLQLDQGDELGQVLYRLILSKRVAGGWKPEAAYRNRERGGGKPFEADTG